MPFPDEFDNLVEPGETTQEDDAGFEHDIVHTDAARAIKRTQQNIGLNAEGPDADIASRFTRVESEVGSAASAAGAAGSAATAAQDSADGAASAAAAAQSTADGAASAAAAAQSTADGAASAASAAQSGVDALEAIHVDSKEPTGIVNAAEVSVTFTPALGRVDIAPVGAAWSFYAFGTKFERTAPESIVISDVTATHFVYYTSSGVLTTSTTPWNLAEHVPVTAIVWNATLADGFALEERHGVIMDSATHKRLHEIDGTQVVSGFGISGYTLQSASSNAAVSPAIATGILADEDLHSTNPGVPDGGPYTLFWREGASGEWRWSKSNSILAAAGTTYILANTLSGSWGFTELSGGEFVNVWLCAVPSLDPDFAIIVVQGQVVHTSLSNAEAESIGSVQFGALPFPEIAALYRVTLRTGSSYTGTTGRHRVESVTRIVGQSIVSLAGVAPGSHSALSGRSDAASHPASAVETNTSGFNGALSATDDTVQKALDTLDEGVAGKAPTSHGTHLPSATGSDDGKVPTVQSDGSYALETPSGGGGGGGGTLINVRAGAGGTPSAGYPTGGAVGEWSLQAVNDGQGFSFARNLLRKRAEGRVLNVAFIRHNGASNQGYVETATPHGLNAGATVVIAGTGDAAFDGTRVVTGVSSAFDFFFTSSRGSVLNATASAGTVTSDTWDALNEQTATLAVAPNYGFVARPGSDMNIGSGFVEYSSGFAYAVKGFPEAYSGTARTNVDAKPIRWPWVNPSNGLDSALVLDASNRARHSTGSGGQAQVAAVGFPNGIIGNVFAQISVVVDVLPATTTVGLAFSSSTYAGWGTRLVVKPDGSMEMLLGFDASATLTWSAGTVAAGDSITLIRKGGEFTAFRARSGSNISTVQSAHRSGNTDQFTRYTCIFVGAEATARISAPVAWIGT